MPKTISTFNSNFPKAFTAAFVICLALRFGDLILPVNAFTYRFWEALIVHKMSYYLTGPFYPNFKGRMSEVGDLAPYTKYSVRKDVYWETDSYGFRVSKNSTNRFPIVVVGDSAILGTGLTQTDTFAAQLEREMDAPVYSYSPYYEMTHFLRDRRFITERPKQVIFSSTEWTLPEVLAAPQKPVPIPGDYFLKAVQKFLTPQRYQALLVCLDRASKESLMRFVSARLKGGIKHFVGAPVYRAPSPYGTLIFPGQKTIRPVYGAELAKQIVPILKRYQQELLDRGIEFYFAPIPYKETVYADVLPPHPNRGEFYNALITEARGAGIHTIDLLEAYRRVQRTDPKLLFQLDDSHWNEWGVGTAAQEIAQVLKSKGEIASG